MNDTGASSNLQLPQHRDSSKFTVINLHGETGIPPTIKVLDGEVTKVLQAELTVISGYVARRRKVVYAW